MKKRIWERFSTSLAPIIVVELLLLINDSLGTWMGSDKKREASVVQLQLPANAATVKHAMKNGFSRGIFLKNWKKNPFEVRKRIELSFQREYKRKNASFCVTV